MTSALSPHGLSYTERMTERNALTRRDFVLQTAVIAGSMLVGGNRTVGAQSSQFPVAVSQTLWYKRPAAQWVEALPIGNGRMGAMILFEHGDQARGGYRRQLDIGQAIADVRYTIGATSYSREIFASHPDRVFIPYQIGSRGQLQEWAKDFPEQDTQHRHFSHLFGVHPGKEITREGTPTLFAAARKAMELRGDLATGWSMAWKMNFWARMQDGAHAFLLLTNLLKPSGSTQTMSTGGGGVYPLPALPSAWPSGRVRGLRARGGIEVDVAWKDGALQQASLTASRATMVRVRHGTTVTEQRVAARVPMVMRGLSTS
jgi:hypothetical protein